MKKFLVLAATCSLLSISSTGFADVGGSTTAKVLAPNQDRTIVGGSHDVTATGGFTFSLTGGPVNGHAYVQCQGYIKVDGVTWAQVYSVGANDVLHVDLDDEGKWSAPPKNPPPPPGTPPLPPPEPLKASDTRSLADASHSFVALSTFSYVVGSTSDSKNANEDKTFTTGPATATGGEVTDPPAPSGN